MPRYFLEVSYKGTAYSGFQVQANAGSIQEEIEKAFAVFFRKPVMMTGASITRLAQDQASKGIYLEIGSRPSVRPSKMPRS